jgi:ABC-2 type transport system ATP-binding protein
VSLQQKVRNYSLGMQQQFGIAQAVMEDQRILILDEPFNALDADSADTLRTLLSRYRDEGRTIIFTSHNRDDIDTLADTIHRLHRQQLAPVFQDEFDRLITGGG